MALFLADTSTWARRGQPAVAALLADANDAGGLAITAPVLIELLTSARSVAEYRHLALLYGSLHEIPLNHRIGTRAARVQAMLAERGHHRGPSAVDLLTAAAAELTGSELWHCDKHFDHIAAATGQPIRRVGR